MHRLPGQEIKCVPAPRDWNGPASQLTLSASIAVNAPKSCIAFCTTFNARSPGGVNRRPLDPWRLPAAMSILQKTIRRGREELGARRAATLLRDARDKLLAAHRAASPTRTSGASLEAVGLATAALVGKHARGGLGGERAVASQRVGSERRNPQAIGNSSRSVGFGQAGGSFLPDQQRLEPHKHSHPSPRRSSSGHLRGELGRADAALRGSEDSGDEGKIASEVC